MQVWVGHPPDHVGGDHDFFTGRIPLEGVVVFGVPAPTPQLALPVQLQDGALGNAGILKLLIVERIDGHLPYRLQTGVDRLQERGPPWCPGLVLQAHLSTTGVLPSW